MKGPVSQHAVRRLFRSSKRLVPFVALLVKNVGDRVDQIKDEFQTDDEIAWSVFVVFEKVTAGRHKFKVSLAPRVRHFFKNADARLVDWIMVALFGSRTL